MTPSSKKRKKKLCVCVGSLVNSGLTLAVLTVLVSSSCHCWVHVVAGGAVGRRAVGLRWREAVHRLNWGVVGALAAAGGDDVGWRSVQVAVEWRNGEVVLRLGGHATRVTQDAHHLKKRKEDNVTRVVGKLIWPVACTYYMCLEMLLDNK